MPLLKSHGSSRASPIIFLKKMICSRGTSPDICLIIMPVNNNDNSDAVISSAPRAILFFMFIIETYGILEAGGDHSVICILLRYLHER